MLIFAILLVAAGVVVGIYAATNGGTADITLFGYHWNTYHWVPAAVAAAGIGLIGLLAVAYGTARIRRLRRTTVALRTELAQARAAEQAARGAEQEAIRSAQAAPAPVATPEREMVGRGVEHAPVQEPVPAADRMAAQGREPVAMEAGAPSAYGYGGEPAAGGNYPRWPQR